MIVYRKIKQTWSSSDRFPHHNNAPANMALSVQQFLAKNNMTVIPHPPYSPDLAPCDFFLFPPMKGQMKGKRFADVREVNKKTLEVLNSISTEEFRSDFSSVKNDGTNILSQREGTLKETRVVIV